MLPYLLVIIYIFVYKLDGWNKCKNPYKKLDFGKWELQLPANPDGSCPIKHGSKVKVYPILILKCFLASSYI
jgi:hypothetical protein